MQKKIITSYNYSGDNFFDNKLSTYDLNFMFSIYYIYEKIVIGNIFILKHIYLKKKNEKKKL